MVGNQSRCLIHGAYYVDGIFNVDPTDVVELADTATDDFHCSDTVNLQLMLNAAGDTAFLTYQDPVTCECLRTSKGSRLLF